MGLQTIIDMAETIDFDRRKVVGVQYTRSEVAKISETPTRNTWKMNVNVAAMLAYERYRGLIEQIDYLDRRYPETITFSNNPNLSFMLKYQGDANVTNLSTATIQSWTGTTLVLDNLPAISSSAYLFRQGDFIQAYGLPYPTTVTQDVLRGTSSTVALTTHRPNFMGTATNNQTLVVGNAVQFRMFCSNMPTYRMNPGGRTALVTWSGPFQMYEYTGEV
jgi:hypothetical protein